MRSDAADAADPDGAAVVAVAAARGADATFDMTARIERLRRVLDGQGADAALITDLVSIRWLTGFTGSSAVALAMHDRIVLVTDGRYSEQAPEELAGTGVDAEVRISTTPTSELAPLVAGARVAGEADHLTWGAHRAYTDAFGRALDVLATPMVVLRAVKDAGEVARIRAAAAIADAALAEVAPSIVGATERDVALELEIGMRRRGATSSAYETIVASGPNAALPHARPTDRRIAAGDLVIIDVGARFDGYRSDMTRTFVVGDPSAEQAEWLDLVRRSQEAGVAAVAAGVATRAVDTACRAVIVDAGLGSQFSHGAGHGVGLDIHEHPQVNSRSDDVLDVGMLVTVEPGVYLSGRGGVRWEDLHLVTAHGAEAVTRTPKHPNLAV